MRYPNRVPISYELTAANVAEALLVGELLVDAGGLGEGDLARRLLGNLAYRSGELAEVLAQGGIRLATEKADRHPTVRQQVEVCFAALYSSASSVWTRRAREDARGLGYQDSG